MIDAEKLVLDWLTGEFPSARVSTEVPATIAGHVIRVLRIGGANRFVVDRAVVDVDCWALTRIAARALAESVRDSMCFRLPGTVTAAGGVSAVTTIAAPIWRPWDNTNVRRFGATFQLITR